MRGSVAVQPVLLLWGADDPWIRPQSAERIRSLYPRAEKVLLPGVGHCPQVSTSLAYWLKRRRTVLMGLQEHHMNATVPVNTAKTQHVSLVPRAVVLVFQDGTVMSAELHGCAQICAVVLGSKHVSLGAEGTIKGCSAASLHDSKMQLCSHAG